MEKQTTEDLFQEIMKNDKFLDNYVTSPTERIRISVELEILKILGQLINEKKKEA